MKTGILDSQIYSIKAIHIAERLRLKDFKDSFDGTAVDFSTYEMIVTYSAHSMVFLYNYGSVVFFNVPEPQQEVILGELVKTQGAFEHPRSQDGFLLEIQSGSAIRVFFDRVVVPALSAEFVKIICMLLAESTALSYYENLIEELLVRINLFSKALRKNGKMIQPTKELHQFIGLCLDTKQEIISNLYIVDSPDETWESVLLDKLHQDLKLMLEINTRYRALEYKIKIIQESIEVIADFVKTRREVLLELLIIALISAEIVISLMKWHS